MSLKRVETGDAFMDESIRRYSQPCLWHAGKAHDLGLLTQPARLMRRHASPQDEAEARTMRFDGLITERAAVRARV